MLGSEFLNLALSGEALTAEHIRELLRTHTEEDQWVDFKSGKLLSEKDAGAAKVGKPIDPAGKLRRYVSSFANAEGGAVVVGVVDQKDRADHIDGCSDVGNETPKIWAQRVLAPLAYHLTAPVRCHEVAVDGFTVLVVAVGRSDRLVPCTEFNQLVHYMRIGEQSPAVPEYLVKDVVLGRRQRPEISVHATFDASPGVTLASLDFRVRVRNEGLQPIPSYVVALARYREATPDPAIGPGLRRFLEVMPSSLAVVHPGVVVRSAVKPLAPFTESEPLGWGIELIRASERFAACTVKAVLMVVPEGDLPHLMQITARLDGARLKEWSAEPLPQGSKGVVAVEC
jgi:hypothetical protein